MLIKTILFKNNLIKKIKSKNFLKTKKKFLELKKDYKMKKIPLLTSFEKNYKFGYSKKLVRVLIKKKKYNFGRNGWFNSWSKSIIFVFKTI